MNDGGTLCRRNPDLYPDLARAIPFGQARVGDLRRSLGSDHPQPRSESPRRRLDPRKSTLWVTVFSRVRA
jgi:hypothetical protein